MSTNASRSFKKPYTWAHHWKVSFDACIDASRKEGDKPVKIAIFDTGVDLNHPDIMKAVKEGRVQSYDFVDDKDDIVDLDGHGTYCASLLLKFAPTARIFIGRVFRKSQSSDTTPIVKAIKEAYQNWHVDIMSISLGFSNPSQTMEDEIARAAAERVLIFASAANHTVHEQQPIRFPASMSQVFCIFSADAEGKLSSFNPEPKRGSYNFMFPGERIKGAWPACHTEGVPDIIHQNNITYRIMSGTSCATPIAAAVAAGVLEFVWQPRQRPIKNLHGFRTRSGMERVFLEMARARILGDRVVYYVLPWTLITPLKDKADISAILQHIIEN
ncbi:hypothetical protein V3481_016340 [Fusarium oxysporum f. sp. vasinfectum]|uniref:Peptidase S8/S53 domain-containing protein n=1 Tax=Fusarium oxysporum f. sp. vasinfectum 25433 TaxID=1089449 RepID=X0L3K9_FUSOX|nr:hypothetical protein FOTG_11637 [Fusarium oxysporum f. sp. vasinfectum 25433]